MFQFPASISFISDLGIVLLYFLKPTVFGDTYSHSWWELLDLYNSFLALVILAGNNVNRLHTFVAHKRFRLSS
jgi:hypothetical protein